MPDQTPHSALSLSPDRPAPAPLARIVLTGFMGAGKSTVGALLAVQLGWKFLDIDQEIEAAHQGSVAQLFAERGEPWFREAEHHAILRSLTFVNVVLGLGGGAIEDPRTRHSLLSDPATLLIHLEVALPVVLLRCQGTEPSRPVLADQPRLASRYQLRLPLYRLAHHSISVDALTPDQVATAIRSHLHL